MKKPVASDVELPDDLSAEQLMLMRRRFIESLRRAEIIEMVNDASSEAELGITLAEELCEAFDAEVGFVVSVERDGPRSLLGSIGTVGDERARLTASAQLGFKVLDRRAVTESGSDLLGVGGRNSLIAAHELNDDLRIAFGVVRTYEQDFDEAEGALLSAVALGAGRAIERLRALGERDRAIAQLKQSFIGTVEALANALEARDDYTADHASEVAGLAIRVGRELGMDEAELEDLHYGALFHDIGKIAIPDAILNKPGPLVGEELTKMREHPEIGARIVGPIPFLSETVKQMVRHDHERWDGRGYPDGLAGADIPLGARIILVVDSFHAMTSDRPYRKAMPREAALQELRDHSGTQFDPGVVAAFLRLVR